MKWTDLFTNIFNDSFASRWTGDCSGWTKELAAYHVVADVSIWVAYMAIPLLLVRLARTRKDMPFSIFFFMFSAFIIGCGLTHFMGAITVFFPYYYIDFWVKAFTGIISLWTAYMFWVTYPDMVKLPNPFTILAVIEKANQDLAKSNKELEEMIKTNRLLENFALIAAHDLQDPLKQNTVFLRLVREGRTEFMVDMEKNNARMDAFVKSLLAFARSGGGNLKFEKVPMNIIMGRVITDLQKRIEESGAKVIVGSLPTVICDKIQFARVFQNLLSNAIKCKHPDRQCVIEVNCEDGGDVWKFTVQDNGIGISASQMGDLFMIYRGKKNDTTGAGFGLAICKRVIESHHGHIIAESEEGSWTRFIFTIKKKLDSSSNLVSEPPPHDVIE